MSFHRRQPVVLLVEDNPGDVRLVELALAETSVKPRLIVCSNGTTALELFAGDPGDDMPDLILLDLNLPGVDGRAVLSRLKEDEELRVIPVVVLTSSPAPIDVQRCYQLHANAYVRKPTEIDRYMEMMELLTAFWLETSVTPKSLAASA